VGAVGNPVAVGMTASAFVAVDDEDLGRQRHLVDTFGGSVVGAAVVDGRIVAAGGSGGGGFRNVGALL